jgi:hypothetical protein
LMHRLHRVHRLHFVKGDDGERVVGVARGALAEYRADR